MDNWEERLYQDAVAILADQQLRARQASDLPRLGSPGAWLAKAAQTTQAAHRNTVSHLDLTRYTAETLAERLQNPPRTGAQTGPGWRESRPYCAACGGNFWVDSQTVDSYQFVVRCPACNPTPTSGATVDG